MNAQFLPSYEELKADRKMYAKSFYTQYLNTDAFSGKRLAEPYSEHLYVVQNPPSKPLSVTEMDDIYDLPYMRLIIRLIKRKEESRNFGDPLQPDQQQGMFRRMQFLCAYISPGAYCTGQKS